MHVIPTPIARMLLVPITAHAELDMPEMGNTALVYTFFNQN